MKLTSYSIERRARNLASKRGETMKTETQHIQQLFYEQVRMMTQLSALRLARPAISRRR